MLLYKKEGSYAANKIEVKTDGYLHVKLAVFCFIQTQILKGFLLNLSDQWALKPFKVLSHFLKESHIGNSYWQKGLFTSHRMGINLIKRELFLPSMCLLHVSHRVQINAQNGF